MTKDSSSLSLHLAAAKLLRRPIRKTPKGRVQGPADIVNLFYSGLDPLMRAPPDGARFERYRYG